MVVLEVEELIQLAQLALEMFHQQVHHKEMMVEEVIPDPMQIMDLEVAEVLEVQE